MPREPLKEVYGFEREFRFLSNYAPSKITVDEITYSCVEAAFAAAKTTDRRIREAIAAATTPGDAKAIGRSRSTVLLDGRPTLLVLRPDWEAIKDATMRFLLRKKYAITELRSRLLATGDARLVEANTWNDRVWGVDFRTGIGENRLGRYTEDERARIRGVICHRDSNGDAS